LAGRGDKARGWMSSQCGAQNKGGVGEQSGKRNKI